MYNDPQNPFHESATLKNILRKTYFHNPVVLYLNIVRTYYDHKHWTFDIVIPFPSVYK